MRAAIAGDTSFTYYCLEYLCRSGVTDLTLILPRANHIDNYDRAEFESLIGEFGLPLLQFPFAPDEKNIHGIDLLISLEWPGRLRLPLNARLGVVSTNLARQFSAKNLSDLAAALDSGADHFRLELTFVSPDAKNNAIIAAVVLPICPVDNLRSLKTKAAAATARQLLRILTEGHISDETCTTGGSTTLSTRIDRVIDWRRPASELQNKIRAYTHPGPGCITRIENHNLCVWHGHEFDRSGNIYEQAEPGTVLDVVEEVGIVVQTSNGSFLITKIQQAGSPELPSWVWAYGFHLKPNDRFDTPRQERIAVTV